MFIPHGTDAPIYHAPVVTVTILLLNVGIFFAEPVYENIVHPEPSSGHHRTTVLKWFIHGGYDGPEEYTLQFGHGIKPWQGVTAAFLHANVVHLLINMGFLLLFGLIVEGKVGWWKFTGIYFGIAFARGMLLQLLVMLFNPGFQGAALGASGIIYALIGIAFVWAPLNTIQVTVGGRKHFNYYDVEEIDVPIYVMAGCFLVFDVLLAFSVMHRAGGLVPYTPVLHSFGALLGVAVGIGMLKLRLVDCEHFDLFSVVAGRHHQSRAELEPEATQEKEYPQTSQGLKQIRSILSEGHDAKLAYQAHKTMTQRYATWHLPDREFLLIIKQLCQQKHDNEAAQAMEEYLNSNRSRHAQVRLKLAEHLAGPMQQPNPARDVLHKVNYDMLSSRGQQVYDQIAARVNASKIPADTPLSPDDW